MGKTGFSGCCQYLLALVENPLNRAARICMVQLSPPNKLTLWAQKIGDSLLATFMERRSKPNLSLREKFLKSFCNLRHDSFTLESLFSSFSPEKTASYEEKKSLLTFCKLRGDCDGLLFVEGSLDFRYNRQKPFVLQSKKVEDILSCRFLWKELHWSVNYGNLIFCTYKWCII